MINILYGNKLPFSVVVLIILLVQICSDLKRPFIVWGLAVWSGGISGRPLLIKFWWQLLPSINAGDNCPELHRTKMLFVTQNSDNDDRYWIDQGKVIHYFELQSVEHTSFLLAHSYIVYDNWPQLNFYFITMCSLPMTSISVLLYAYSCSCIASETRQELLGKRLLWKCWPEIIVYFFVSISQYTFSCQNWSICLFSNSVASLH